jgi:hypothetical protein
MSPMLKQLGSFRTSVGGSGWRVNKEQRSTDASDADIARVKQLADEGCPAIWAMDHQVPHTTEVRRS